MTRVSSILIAIVLIVMLPSVASSAYVTIQVVGNGHVEVYEGPSLTLLANATSSYSIQTQYTTNTLHKFTPVADAGYRLNRTSCNVITNICSIPINSFYYSSSTPDYYIYEFVQDSMPLIFEVIGTGGSFYAYKNGSLEGMATPGTTATVNYRVGDQISFHAYPDVGYIVSSVCDYPNTECQTLEWYSYTVTGQLPVSMKAWFSLAGTPTPTPTPTPTSTPGPTPTPTPTSTPTPTPTPTPSSIMPLIFEVSGEGQFYVYKNSNLEGLATPGYNVIVNYSLNDEIMWLAYPYLNYHVISVCDHPQTECRPTGGYSGIVTGQLPERMIATFGLNSTESMPLIFEVIGSGQFYAFNNGSLEGVASPGYPATVQYKIGDTISFYAYPYIGYNVSSVCDFPQTECLSNQTYSYTVIDILPQKMIAAFTKIESTPTPNIPGGPGYTPDNPVKSFTDLNMTDTSDIWSFFQFIWDYKVMIGAIFFSAIVYIIVFIKTEESGGSMVASWLILFIFAFYGTTQESYSTWGVFLLWTALMLVRLRF